MIFFLKQNVSYGGYGKMHNSLSQKTRFVHGIYIEFTWFGHWIYTILSQNLYDLFMEFTRFVYGIYKIFDFKLQIRQLIRPKLSIMQAKYKPILVKFMNYIYKYSIYAYILYT